MLLSLGEVASHDIYQAVKYDVLRRTSDAKAHVAYVIDDGCKLVDPVPIDLDMSGPAVVLELSKICKQCHNVYMFGPVSHACELNGAHPERYRVL